MELQCQIVGLWCKNKWISQSKIATLDHGWAQYGRAVSSEGKVKAMKLKPSWFRTHRLFPPLCIQRHTATPPLVNILIRFPCFVIEMTQNSCHYISYFHKQRCSGQYANIPIQKQKNPETAAQKEIGCKTHFEAWLWSKTDTITKRRPGCAWFVALLIRGGVKEVNTQ